ncbi:MAG: hypothetical protein AAB928_01360, partial [Patescibacteria group bacterium]
WSLDSVFSVGLAAAGATALGGYVADRFGFTVLFMIASAGSVFSSLLLLGLINHLAPHRHVQDKIIPDRRRSGKYWLK